MGTLDPQLIRTAKILQYSNRERNEQNDADCKLLLEHLRFNEVVTVLDLNYSTYFGSSESCQVLGEFVKSSRTLTDLSMYEAGMYSGGLSYIIRGLLESQSTALRRLEIGCNYVGKRGGELVEELLLRNIPTFVTLGICGTKWTREEIAPVARALAKNTTLRYLNCGGGYNYTSLDHEGPMSMIFRALTAVEVLTREQESYQDNRYNQTIETLRIIYTYEKGIAEDLVQMLAHNKCLTYLGLRYFHFNREQWGEVWRALKDHPRVQVMELYHSTWGAGLGDAFNDLMELLQANRTIEYIELGETSLDAGGYTPLVKQQLEKNRRLAEYLGTLKSKLRFVPPRIGRLFLCGYPQAGKTTLRRSMVGTQRNVISRTVFAATAWMAKQPCTFPSFFDKRTQGIEIRLLQDSQDKQIAVWDLAGQDEYHALHDSHYMFPDINQACVFLFLYKPVINGGWQEKDSAKKLDKELCYWLGFITSNYKRAGWVLPQVSVVLTHLDKLSYKFGQIRTERAENYISWARTEGNVDHLRKYFKGRVDLNTKVHAVDATSARDARKVVQDVFERFDNLFSKRLPQVPAACEEMNLSLAKWTVTHRSHPIIPRNDFFRLCTENVKELDSLFQEVPERLVSEAAELRTAYRAKNEQAVASYLHDVGSIIHFPASSFVVVDPNWLGQVFLGQLFRPVDGKCQPIIRNSTPNGCVSHEDLRTNLKDFIRSRRYRGFTAEDLILLMKELELCYEEDVEAESTDPPKSRSYFIPSTLSDRDLLAREGRRQLEWQVQSGFTPIYTGLRLQCSDQSRTFLSLGFFQRFQVHLQKYFRGKCVQYEYKIEKNLIRMKHDGLEMIVEKSREDGLLDGDFVDILARCHSPARNGEHPLISEVVKQLRDFCASREGCPGVVLEEAILRPGCVERLTLCCNRKDQAVVKETLRKDVMKKMFESDELKVWDDDSYAKSITDLSQIYQHRFPPVPCDDELPEEFIDAMSMLNSEDVKESIYKYKATIQEKKYSVFQAVDEVQKLTGAEVPSISQTTSRDIPSASQSGKPQEPEEPPDGPESWNSTYVVETIVREIRVTKNEIISKIEEQTLLLRHIEKSMNDIRTLYQLLHSTLMDKMDEVVRSIAELQDIPSLPYFSDKTVHLKQRLVAFINIGQAVKLHFMCENPNQPHFLESQKGLDLVNLLQGDTYKILRPLILGSIKILFILVKVGFHVAAGIGNAIPDFQMLPGVEPISALALTGETVMDSIKWISSIPIDSTLADAWAWIQNVMGPVKAKGQISEKFQLYQVRFKSRMLAKYLAKRNCFWLCTECRSREAKNDNLLQH